MTPSRFITTAIVSLAMLLLSSDAGCAGKKLSGERFLIRPVTADLGADHQHLAVLLIERNLFDPEENTYCTAGLAFLDAYNLSTSENSARAFYSALAPKIEIGRKLEQAVVSKVGFYGKAGFLNEGNRAWFDYGIVLRAGPTQLKAGVFRGSIHYEASRRDDLDDLSLKRSESVPAAVSYITVGLSPTFRF